MLDLNSNLKRGVVLHLSLVRLDQYRRVHGTHRGGAAERGVGVGQDADLQKEKNLFENFIFKLIWETNEWTDIFRAKCAGMFLFFLCKTKALAKINQKKSFSRLYLEKYGEKAWSGRSHIFGNFPYTHTLINARSNALVALEVPSLSSLCAHKKGAKVLINLSPSFLGNILYYLTGDNFGAKKTQQALSPRASSRNLGKTRIHREW